MCSREIYHLGESRLYWSLVHHRHIAANLVLEVRSKRRCRPYSIFSPGGPVGAPGKREEEDDAWINTADANKRCNNKASRHEDCRRGKSGVSALSFLCYYAVMSNCAMNSPYSVLRKCGTTPCSIIEWVDPPHLNLYGAGHERLELGICMAIEWCGLRLIRL